jgi:hypothetical protein
MTDNAELIERLRDAVIVADTWKRSYEQTATALSALVAERDALREALKPFAKQAGIFDPYEVEPMKFVYTDDFEPFDMTGFGTRIAGLTVGDLRRARAALAQGPR